MTNRKPCLCALAHIDKLPPSGLVVKGNIVTHSSPQGPDATIHHRFAPFEMDNSVEGRLIHGRRDRGRHEDKPAPDEGAPQGGDELVGGGPRQAIERPLYHQDARPPHEAAHQIEAATSLKVRSSPCGSIGV